jgi:hypothetical protein
MSTSDAATRLAQLTAQIDKRDGAAELLALATAIDELGREVALEIAQDASAAASLRPVLLAVAPAYTRALLRAAEKYDDMGSPRRAAFALVEALRRAFDAGNVDVVGAALIFVLDAGDQAAAAARVRDIVDGAGDTAVPRRELRKGYIGSIDELRALIDWGALDDEPTTS